MALHRLKSPSGYIYETTSAFEANDLVADKGYTRITEPRSTSPRRSVRKAEKPEITRTVEYSSEGVHTASDADTK